MKHGFVFVTALASLVMGAAGMASAQNGAKPDFAPAEQPVQPPLYRSAFEDYKRYEELPPPERWREANEALVRGAGEHAGHGPAPAPAKPQPKSSDHDRHGKDQR